MEKQKSGGSVNGIGTFDTEYDLTVAFNQVVVSSLSRLKTEFGMGRPFMSSQVSSVSSKTMGRSIHFEDRMEAETKASLWRPVLIARLIKKPIVAKHKRC